MNLMKLFNINFLKQNFKKSKVILSIFTGLIPVLNTIILIMAFSNTNNYIFNFAEISAINFIGVYILPIIVSVCLFNYIYKKKSVDFINSMPISRKSIFVTNTIFGILIFLSMLVVNLILMLSITYIFNIPIPFGMMFDYLWYWFIVYIFAFSATNLAMSVSGNAITQIIVTSLLVFLIPFTHMITNVLQEFNTNTYDKTYLECASKECMPENYYCYDDLECSINKNSNIYEISLEKQEAYNYTSLFGFISIILNGEDAKIINTTSILKMVTLSIIYTILGYILFIKRKMEVSETSFKNIHIHNIVKSLTLIPIVAISYIICRYETIVSFIFVLIIILIYYFVYDLITKKSINNIKLSLIYFIFAVSILTAFYSLVDITSEHKKQTILNYQDIKQAAVDLSLNNGYYQKNTDKIYINDKQLISIIIKNSFNDYTQKDKNYTFKVYLKDKKNNEYKKYININEEDYNKIINILENNKQYLNNYKNIDFDKVYAVKLGNNLYNKKESKTILNLVKDTLSNLTLKELLELQRKYNNVDEDSYINLYTYKNHDRMEFRVNGYINYNLLNSIINANNERLKQNISYIIPENYSIYFKDKYTIEEFEIDYYILRNAKTDIYNFILKEIKLPVDMKKEFITLEVNIDYENYTFTTNNIKEFKEILYRKTVELKNTEEYKNYHNINNEKYYYDFKEYSYDY